MNYKMKEKDRLTTRTLYKGVSLNPDESCSRSKDCYKCNIPVVDCPRVNNAITRLAYYEDLDTQGKLPKLPCTAGDYIYILTDENEIHECFVTRVDYSQNCWENNSQIFVTGLNGFPTVLYGEDFGHNIFLSQRKAEEKLKELSKND